MRIYYFFFKQKTAYEMSISDWSSDVCSSDLVEIVARPIKVRRHRGDIVATVLFAIRLAKLDARDLRHRIPFVRRLERAGKERLLADRLEIGRASCGERGCKYV